MPVTIYISHQRDVEKEFCFKAIKRSLHSSAKEAGAGVILIGLIRFLPSFSDVVSFYCPGRLQNCGCHRRSLLLGRLFLSPVRLDFSVGYHLRWLCVCSSVTVVWLFSLFALLIVTEDSVA